MTYPWLEVEVEDHDGTTILRVAGEIDMATAGKLRPYLLDTEDRVVVDLRAVSLLDSSGIAVLAEASTRLALSDGTLTLRKPQGTVRRALEIVGLVDWIED
jgi:anti-anti-sigma factor